MRSPEIGQESGGQREVVPGIDVHIQSFSTYLRGLCKSEGTIKQYVCDVNGWWAWWQRPVFLFDLEAWDAWTSWQAEQGYKGMTVRMHQMGVRRFYRFLVRRKIVSVSPCEKAAGAESIEVADRFPEVLTQGEVAAMRRVPNRARTKALFALLYDCGLRNSEARQLPLDHVREDHIRVIGKRNRIRKIPIMPFTRGVIEDWIAERPLGTPHLFPTAGGNAVGMESLCKLVKYWAKSSRLELKGRRITAHTLRHSIATHLIERGMTIEKVQEFMGHRSIETTRIYVHIAQSFLKDAVERSHPMADAKP